MFISTQKLALYATFLVGVFDSEELHMLNRGHRNGLSSLVEGLARGLAALGAGLAGGLAALGAGLAGGSAGGSSPCGKQF